ncbi:MAG TPA: transglutaminase-like domain-containing protein, partial [Planctomycetota bacterium]|nr:transglutaminase-like domain-containing protein [Planctomycetota bacterium]
PVAPVPTPRPAVVRTTPRDEAPPPVEREGATTRWYEMRRQGQKLGWIRVVWAPSTWQGKPTVHDTTTVRTREMRDMLGTEDVFEHETVVDVERGEDGTLWWSRAVVTEAGGRATVEETTWTGTGYDVVARLAGAEKVTRVAATAPAHVDPEAFLGPRIAAGKLAAGDRLSLRVLQAAAERVAEFPLEVLGTAPGPSEDGEVPCLKVRQTDPETGAEAIFWLDAQGVVARVKEPLTEIVRVPESKALERPVRPASFSITVPSTPPLPRVFSAERLLVDVHVRPDPDRPLPDFPASPFSRILEVTGDAKAGWIAHAELRAYDVPQASARVPVTDPAFAKDLEPTLLMPCDHPDLRVAASRALAGETDARRAVQRIADVVFALDKQSPAVAQASAIEILRDRQGDCSEHALLFVALCRAAGIPARRCSGYVCVGSHWGAHAWAEAWVGAWIGVDPTTNDVGTAARYLFFGYDDVPSGKLGTVSVRARGRLRFVTRRVEEGGDKYDLDDDSTWRVVDADAGRAVHRLAGLDLRDVPAAGAVTLAGEGDAVLRLPEGVVTIRVTADQGHRSLDELASMAGGDGEQTTFAGAPAVRVEARGRRTLVIASRKRILVVNLRAKSTQVDALEARVATIMAATLAASPPGP